MYGNKNLENLSIAFIAILIVALSLFERVRITYPMILAYVDPSYFGFMNIAGDIYVEPRMPDREREALLSTVGTSEKQLSQFYGCFSSHPRMFICANEDCYRRLKGGHPKGMALLSIALFLSPRGTNETTMTHDLSHIELHARVEMFANFSGAEADELRRAVGMRRSWERMKNLEGKLRVGMAANGIPPETQD